jgi:succinyl-diaminopimelate desuccinylase
MKGPITESIVKLTQDLVRIPSRAGVDSYTSILERISQWLNQSGVASEGLANEQGQPVGICGHVAGRHPGPTYLLNATVDTAGFGDESRWTRPPISAAVIDGWLHGRGSADSKSGVAIFCHVLAAFTAYAERMHGTLGFLFDADEHSGAFAGVKRYVELRVKRAPIAGVMIGYPGFERVVAGSRGYFRAVLRVHGEAAHSGATHSLGVNAIERGAQLVTALSAIELDAPVSAEFPVGPKVTVTAFAGGQGFSMVPDLCTLLVDVRLTPSFDAAQAEAVLARVTRDNDRRFAAQRPTDIEVQPGWPAYRLPPDSPMVKALQEAAERILGHRPPADVAGPSNAGNYLATLRIPATSGFGVAYRNVHAADECIELRTIEPVYQVYHLAAEILLRVSS